MAGWVCPECGLDYDTVSPLDAINAVRSFPRRYRALLTTFDNDEDPDSLLYRRPQPDVWSAIEYTAHVADTLDYTAPQIRRMLVEDNPVLQAWDPDQRAADERYNERPLRQVVGELETACADLAATLDSVDADDWRRTGRFPYGERDVLTITRNMVHEGSHHLRDVDRVLRSVRGRAPEDD